MPDLPKSARQSPCIALVLVASVVLASDGGQIAVFEQKAVDAVAEAEALGALWLNTRATLSRAQILVGDGDVPQARRLLQEVLREARLALNQALVERARYAYGRLRERERPPPAGAARLAELHSLIAAGKGIEALRLAQELVESYGN